MVSNVIGFFFIVLTILGPYLMDPNFLPLRTQEKSPIRTKGGPEYSGMMTSKQHSCRDFGRCRVLEK